MTETFSLLGELKESGYEGAILTTYNLHIPFLEEVVVRRLHASGCRHIIVLADQHQLAKAIRSDAPRRSGIDYLLLPMPTQTAFHPKINLLAGKSKGFIAVGSHNLTYAGFGRNREVTNVIRYDESKKLVDAVDFNHAWSTLRQWMGSIDLHDEVDDLLSGLTQLAPWLSKTNVATENASKILIGEPGGPALFDQMRSMIAGQVRQIFVTGPFFDSKLEFLNRLITEFQPKHLTVAIDPETSQIPVAAKKLNGADFVNAKKIGPSTADYLHAKILHFIETDGTHHLISGSANPSAPAWLRNNHMANHEAVVVISGEAAAHAANRLGIGSADAEPRLNQSEWEEVSSRWSTRNESTSDDHASTDIVFVCVDSEGVVNVPLGKHSAKAEITMIGSDGHVFPSAPRTKTNADGSLRISLPVDQRVNLIHLSRKDQKFRTAIVHYANALRAKAKSGVQRSFSAAFGSLDTDTPALAELFKCIEKVIDEDQPSMPAKLKKATAKKSKNHRDEPDSLEVDIDDTPIGRKKIQLTAGTNLGHVLDILIRAFGQEVAQDYDNVDAFGRDEEEQVGSDDEDTQPLARTEADAKKALKFCHKKIRSLVKRCDKQLSDFVDHSIDDRNIVFKLVATIGLLSQLRAQDKHIWWVNVDRGESTVPPDELVNLMNSIAKSLLAHPLFLYEPQTEDADIPESDEFARLRGLIFWLGAEAGVSLQLERPFNEKLADKTARIQGNQHFLSLSNLVAGDKDAENAAHTAIDITNVEHRALLHRAIKFRALISRMASKPDEGREIAVGDFAYIPKNTAIGIRAVLHADEQYVALAVPGGSEPRKYETKKAVGIPASGLV